MKMDNVLFVLRGLVNEEWEGDLVGARRQIQTIIQVQEEREINEACPLTEEEMSADRIKATKMYRDRTGCSLKQAYHKVEKYFKEAK